MVIVRETLPQFSDAAMAETWRMVSGEKEVFALPRAGFLRKRDAQSLVSASRPVQCVPAAARCRCPRKLGASADEPLPFTRSA